MSDLKRCTCCKQEFPPTREHFHPATNTADGLRYHCRKCVNAAERERYARKRDSGQLVHKPRVRKPAPKVLEIDRVRGTARTVVDGAVVCEVARVLRTDTVGVLKRHGFKVREV